MHRALQCNGPKPRHAYPVAYAVSVFCTVHIQVQSGQCADLVAHLSRLSVKRIDTLTVRAHEGLSQDVQPAALRASLSLVQALGCAPKELCFSGWSATSDVIREFKALSDIRVLAQAEAGTVKLGLQLVTCGQAPKSTDEWPIVELPRILPRWVHGAGLASHVLWRLFAQSGTHGTCRVP